MAEFKDLFIELRKSRNYTQEQVAKLLDCSNSTVAMWETGKRTPTREKYEAIADLFNVDIDYLYGKTSIKRRVLYDEFGDKYTSDNKAPILSDRAVQVAIAYDAADERARIAAEVALGIDFEKEESEVS